MSISVPPSRLQSEPAVAPTTRHPRPTSPYLQPTIRASSVSYKPRSTLFDPNIPLHPLTSAYHDTNLPQKRSASEYGAASPLDQASPLAITLPAPATQPLQLLLDNETAITSTASPTMGDMVERLHGVTWREDRPNKRLKSKSSTPSFTHTISSTLVQEGNWNSHKPASPETIDLTGDDEYIKVADDVIIVSDLAREEVCYGRLEGARVTAHLVPFLPRGATMLGSQQWPGFKVRLKKRSGNTNIVSVTDSSGKDFGSVDPVTAIGLARVMNHDQISIRTQAHVQPRPRMPGEVSGQPTSASYELSINLYGQRRFVHNVGQFLSQKQLWLRTPFEYDKGIKLVNPHMKLAPLLKPVLPGSAGASNSTYVNRTVEEIRNDVIGMFDTLEESDTLPEAKADSRIATPLMAHQKQGLYFMLNREKERTYSDKNLDKSSLWRLNLRGNGQKIYYNVITGKEERAKPPDVFGGILADMMGLGKTLSIIALIASTSKEAESWAKKKPYPALASHGIALLQNSKTTLIVSPLSTIANWEEQLKAHLKPDTLSYYVYHGGSRCSNIEHLATFDIVITTYSVVSSEFDKRGKKMKDSGISPLEQINWFRIVLDEAHMIREQSTRQSKAICSLSAQRRWAVTGTPVQNRLDDLGALFKFLRIKPFDDKGGFTQFILSPFKNADPEILPKLRLLVGSVTLRRLKDRINLPQKHDRIVRLQFSPEEQLLYDWFHKDSNNKMRVVASEQKKAIGGKAYVHILQAILRLRLICAHGRDLLSEEDLKMTEGFTKTSAIDLDIEESKSTLSPKQASDMYNLMKEAGGDNCASCSSKIGPRAEISPDDTNASKDVTLAWMTPCFHMLCKDCIHQYSESIKKDSVDGDHAVCPLCDQYIPISLVELKQSQLDEEEERRIHARENPRIAKRMTGYNGPHTKTKALLDSLNESRLESEAHPDQPPIKSVVFSGWTSHLDLIHIALDAHNISHVRLDGKMSRAQRTESLDQFRDNPDITVIMVSISAGGLGLNLTTGSRVYVMEPQFNPAAEAQAVDRVHRLGQKREVFISRFIMGGSFEEKMLDLQRKKQNLADLSMERGKTLDRGEATKRRLEELRSLFK
ncbi:MAG: hypothetical protein M1829_002158 [Trizodia sp. TS-e1964]|nr:MAG: hypothetical protein M1829_002158 [Trizodia sp. TS-e1964]